MQPSLDDVELLRPTRTRRIVMAVGAVAVVLVIGVTMVINPTGSPTARTSSVVPPFSTWVSFTSPDGQFSASFPSGPSHSSEPGNVVGAETTTESFTWVSGDGDVRLRISYLDFPPGSLSTISPETGFANMERALTKDGQLVLASRDISSRYAGHEFTVTDAGWHITLRDWIAGDRVYEVRVTGESQYAVAFLDSFRITAE